MVSQIKDVMTRTSWSGIVWKDGYPKEINFISAEIAVFDFDNGESLEKALSIFSSFAHIIGTTKSHQKEKNKIVCDRFRVAIPFESIITDVKKYRWTMRQLTAKYGSDGACIDGARTFLPCKEIVSIKDMGDKLPVFNPPVYKKPAFDEKRYKELPLSNFVCSIMRFGSPPGERNKNCFRACLELARKGYNEQVIESIVFKAIPSTPDFTGAEKKRVIRSAIAYRDKNNS